MEYNIQSGNEQSKYYPYSNLFYLTRNSFWGAGQDSFTDPPAQNPDMFESMSNIEPVLTGNLQRRRGYTLLNAGTNGPYREAYSFRSESLGLRSLVFTSTSNVLAISEDGTGTIANPLFTPTSPASAPRMVLSRDFGYFADGVQQDSLKWNGQSSATTKWGIDISQANGVTFGPQNTGTGANVGSGTAWTNPTNIQGACNGTVASVSLGAPGSSQNLYGHTYGFSGLTGFTVVGIQVDITYTSTQLTPVSGDQFTVQLTLNGTSTVGTPKYLYRQLGLANATLGGPSDLWGLTGLTTSQAQSAAFGIFANFRRGNNSLTVGATVDCVKVTLYTLPTAPTIVSTAAAGLVSLLSGRTYFYAFQNSNTGHTSGLSQASTSTGPLTLKQISIGNLGVSTDPQVDTVLILATLDGNDQTTLYLVDTVSNGVTTYTDNTPDTVLQTQAIYQDTDSQGNLHGIANNNPPPLIKFPVKHKGRIYGAINSSLYFSKSLDDVTTASGLITGKWEEAWPAVNQIDVSEFAETITGLMSDGETLWISTERSIRRLIGDSPQNFQKPEIQFNETGVLVQDGWKVTFYEGQPVGTMWLTPDYRVMASDFNTYEDVGKPIQDVLNNINRAAISTIHAAGVTKGPADYYMLYVPTGSNTTPDTICVFNLKNKRWSIWTPTDSPTASLFNIDSTGNPQWIMATNANPIYVWDDSTRQDRTNNTPVSYVASLTTSWLDLGDSGLKKALNQVLVVSQDTSLTVAINGAITDSQLDGVSDIVIAPTVAQVGPFTDLQVPVAGAVSKHRWYKFFYSSPASTVVDVLDGLYIECIPLLRY